ncbi:MAG TPA: hypothetical protein VEG64_12390 [Candidatus Sulfotelmatobacter sp.]|nr:hypothetical protein [Candidatus Sulfotelmatobacter sp.]
MLKESTAFGKTSFEPRALKRESRRTLSRPIEVSGFDRNGRFFSERTLTFDISDNGCKFNLQTEVDRQSALAIRMIHRRHGLELDSRPVLFEVARMEPQPGGWTMGASLMQPIGPWWIELPDHIKSKTQDS